MDENTGVPNVQNPLPPQGGQPIQPQQAPVQQSMGNPADVQFAGSMSPMQNSQQDAPIQQPVQPTPQYVQPPIVGQIFTPQPIQNRVVPQPPTQPVNSESSTPKLTLDDLYGPSTPQELQAAGGNVPLQQPIQSSEVPLPQPADVQSVPPAQPIQPAQPAASIQQPLSQPIEPIQQPTQPGVPIQRPIMPETPLPTSQPSVFQPPQQVKQTIPQQVTPAGNESRRAESVAKESVHEDAHDSSHGGGFHLPTILRFVIGGVMLLFVILIVFWIGSLILAPKSSGKVTLTYWGLWEDSNVMQPILDDFHKQHPDITVTYTKQDPKDYTKRLLTRMQEGDGPDIFRIHNTWVYPLQNVLLPLPTSVMDTKTLQDNYPPVIAQDMVSNGALYALPLQMDALSLFVNTDIFTHAGASVPKTWDNFITVAKALTVKDPSGRIQTAGAAMGTFDNVTHAPDIISLLMIQNGVNLQKLQSGSNVSDTLSFYTSFAKPDSNVWDNTLDNSLNAFAGGKVAMYFGYSYDILAIQAMNPNLKFAVYPVPHLTGRDITVASYWAEAVSNRSKHQKEAMEFMQYLAQKDTQTKLFTEEAKTRQFGELYARLDLAKQLENNQLLAPIVSQFPQAQSSYFAGDTDYDEYNGTLNQYLANAVNSVSKDTSADSAAATLVQGVQQVLGNYSAKAH